jgi:hypothetical protein
MGAQLKLRPPFFFFRCKTDLVVLKFVDPVNEKWGTLIADFSLCKWERWQLRNLSHDSILEPYTHHLHRDGHNPGDLSIPWMRIDMNLQKQSEYQSSVTRFGSVLDVTSCVESEK